MAAMTTNLSLTEEFLYYFDNMSEPQYSTAAGLLEVYYSPRRFAAETACAMVAAAANILVLVAMRRAYDIMAVGQNRSSSAYCLLFVNLSIANSLSCILSWLSNNSLFLFNSQLIEVLNTEPCLFFLKYGFLLLIDMIKLGKVYRGRADNVREERRQPEDQPRLFSADNRWVVQLFINLIIVDKRTLPVLHLLDGGAVRVDGVWNSQYSDDARVLRGPVPRHSTSHPPVVRQ